MCESLATLPSMKHTDIIDRISRFCVEDTDTGCLVWPRRNVKHVSISWLNKTALAHRKVWEHYHGPITDGLTVDHLCGNGRCQNIDHMRLLTRGDNVRAYYLQMETCKRGHPFTESNTWVSREGWRTCRTCKRLAQQERRAR